MLLPLPRTDSLTRKNTTQSPQISLWPRFIDGLIEVSVPIFFIVFLTLFVFRSALSGLASKKWNDGTLDKYLKSPADYAPGK